MAKSADAFRTISEVADWLETPAHVLRFWESKFSQVKPVKRAGGRRYYRPADMELLGGIKKLLHDDGMTIKGVQKILREEGVKHVAALSQPLEPGLEDYVDATPLDEASGDDQQDSAEIVAMYPDLQDSGATEEPPAAELTPASGEPDSPPAQDKDDRAQADFSSDEEEAPVAEEASVDASEAAEVEAEEQIDQGEDQGQEPEPVPEPPAPLAPKPAILDLPEDPTDDMPAEAGLLSRLSTLSVPENEESRHRIRTLMQRLREVSDRPANRRDS